MAFLRCLRALKDLSETRLGRIRRRLTKQGEPVTRDGWQGRPAPPAVMMREAPQGRNLRQTLEKPGLSCTSGP